MNPLYTKTQLKQVAVEFYYHWHNMQGTNTVQGFDKWFEANADKFASPLLLEVQQPKNTKDAHDMLVDCGVKSMKDQLCAYQVEQLMETYAAYRVLANAAVKELPVEVRPIKEGVIAEQPKSAKDYMAAKLKERGLYVSDWHNQVYSYNGWIEVMEEYAQLYSLSKIELTEEEIEKMARESWAFKYYEYCAAEADIFIEGFKAALTKQKSI